LPGLEPADDAAGDRPGNLLDADRPPAARLFQIDPQLLVTHRAFGVPGVQEGAGEVAEPQHTPGPGHAIDVDVEDRQEDADAERAPAREGRVFHLADVG